MTDKVTSIPKWALLECDSFNITIMRFVLFDQLGEQIFVYSPIIDMELSSDGKRHQNSISTEIHSESAYETAITAVRIGLAFSPFFSETITVVTEDGDELDPLLIDPRLTIKHIVEEIAFEKTQPTSNQVLH